MAYDFEVKELNMSLIRLTQTLFLREEEVRKPKSSLYQEYQHILSYGKCFCGNLVNETSGKMKGFKDFKGLKGEDKIKEKTIKRSKVSPSTKFLTLFCVR